MFYIVTGHGGFYGAYDILIDDARKIVDMKQDEKDNEDLFSMSLAGVDAKTIEKLRMKKQRKKQYIKPNINESEIEYTKNMFDKIFSEIKKK